MKCHIYSFSYTIITMTFNPDIHNRRSIRLQEYDYSSPGYYFVTICAKDRECIFGEIRNGIMGLSELGSIIHNEWLNSQLIRKNIRLDQFVVMPNHIHGIVEIIDHKGIDHVAGIDNGIDRNQSLQRQNPNIHQYGPQSNNLFAIIRGFKGATTKQINQYIGNSEGGSIWQSRFYDRIINTDVELENVKEYIRNNPIHWNDDRNNPANTHLRRD